LLDPRAGGGGSANQARGGPTDPVGRAVGQGGGTRYAREMVGRRLHRTFEEGPRHENHVRHMILLTQQLEYLRAAGFQGIDVYWKRLEWVVYGGGRPAAGGAWRENQGARRVFAPRVRRRARSRAPRAHCGRRPPSSHTPLSP